jgi:L-lactate dehydrogenase (cytochrome)
VAAETFSPKAWAFVSSAATDLHTKQWNSDAYSRITLRPRVLRDVSSVDTRCSMFGQTIGLPLFCSPTSMARLVHPDGEKELVRGSMAANVPLCISSSASFSLSDIFSAVATRKGAGGDPAPLFFQLYVNKDRGKTERLLKEVQSAGVRALFLTVDAPVAGKRESDERIAADESLVSLVSGAAAKNDSKGGGLGRIMGRFLDASLSWDDIPWLRTCAPGLPIVLKGIQTAMDAIEAMKAGVDGILISNHGGRSLDTSPATILVLLELRKCCPDVFDKMEIYIDGGITRGTDIFKALCLGARAVGVGRGILYALNYGEDGIGRFVESGCDTSPGKKGLTFRIPSLER